MACGKCAIVTHLAASAGSHSADSRESTPSSTTIHLCPPRSTLLEADCAMCSVTSSVLSVSACLALLPATQHHCDEVPEGRPSLAFCFKVQRQPSHLGPRLLSVWTGGTLPSPAPARPQWGAESLDSVKDVDSFQVVLLFCRLGDMCTLGSSVVWKVDDTRRVVSGQKKEGAPVHGLPVISLLSREAQDVAEEGWGAGAQASETTHGQSAAPHPVTMDISLPHVLACPFHSAWACPL